MRSVICNLKYEITNDRFQITNDQRKHSKFSRPHRAAFAGKRKGKRWRSAAHVSGKDRSKTRQDRIAARSAKPKSQIRNSKFVGGGTDLYVQKPEEMVDAESENVFDHADLRKIEEKGEFVEIGASVTVTDLLVSPVMQNLFPNLTDLKFPGAQFRQRFPGSLNRSD